MSETVPLQGLTSAEAAERLRKYGPNTVPERRPNPVLVFLGKFWAPVPWMLEATVALQLALGKFGEAIIIAALLLFNSILSFLQESQSNKALVLLRKRLSIQTRVLRDGDWRRLAAEELVPGDIVHLRMGDIVPADMRLLAGELLLDQSPLTGESLPVEASSGKTVYAGATVKRGESTGEVTDTGPRTYFGKTAELVRAAKSASHLERIVFTVVRYLMLLDLTLVAALLMYALIVAIPLREIAPFALILLVASVPVALPATFTVATALGALELSRVGVLITRLPAIEEAAAMDVLCTDKTGTITQNRLTLDVCGPSLPTGKTRYCDSPRSPATAPPRTRSTWRFSAPLATAAPSRACKQSRARNSFRSIRKPSAPKPNTSWTEGRFGRLKGRRKPWPRLS